MEVRIGVAKMPKFDYRESGDSLEVVERPRGGISVVFADGQGSGVAAKRVSRMVVSKAVSLLADGARDGAVARAVHDYLHALKEGKVISTLVIISVDAASKSLVISRNGGPAVVVALPGADTVLDSQCPPIGAGKMVRPSVTQIPMEEGLVLVAATDGITSAGKRFGGGFTLQGVFETIRTTDKADTDALSDAILRQAVELDGGKPEGDMTVMALSLLADTGRPRIARLSVGFQI